MAELYFLANAVVDAIVGCLQLLLEANVLGQLSSPLKSGTAKADKPQLSKTRAEAA